MNVLHIHRQPLRSPDGNVNLSSVLPRLPTKGDPALLQARDDPAHLRGGHGAAVVEDEHMVARNFYRTIEHPAVGTHKVHAVPFRFAASGPTPTARAPLYDEHTRDLLRRYAGVDDAEHAELVAAGLTGHRPQMMEHM